MPSRNGGRVPAPPSVSGSGMTWEERMGTCELCGALGWDVKSGLACYADDGRFERIDRCTSHQACRERVEDSGRTWELVDITNPRWREIPA